MKELNWGMSFCNPKGILRQGIGGAESAEWPEFVQELIPLGRIESWCPDPEIYAVRDPAAEAARVQKREQTFARELDRGAVTFQPKERCAGLGKTEELRIDRPRVQR
jgi:hypothetical protein